MDQQQRDLRRAAAQAFMQSLEQLQETLQPVDDQMPQPKVQQTSKATVQPVKAVPVEPEVAHPSAFDLSSLEQAVADIEEFIQAKRQKRD